jgi:hypothetical protein
MHRVFFSARNPSRIVLAQRPRNRTATKSTYALYKSNHISDDGARLSRVLRSVGDDRGATRAQMFGFEGIERSARNVAIRSNPTSGGVLLQKEPHKWPRTGVSLFGPQHTLAANATKAATGRACKASRLYPARRTPQAPRLGTLAQKEGRPPSPRTIRALPGEFDLSGCRASALVSSLQIILGHVNVTNYAIRSDNLRAC